MGDVRDSPLSRFLLPCDLSIDPRTGAARATVGIRVSPGRSDVAPELALTYSSGARNSPFGFGWMLSGLGSIAVDSRRSVPTYEAGRDRYVHGGDDLVPHRGQTVNGWEPIAEVRGDHRVERFRCRVDQSSQRFERWVHVLTGRVHWRRFDPDGTVSIFGVAGDGTTRIADPADPDGRTVEWLIESQVQTRAVTRSASSTSPKMTRTSIGRLRTRRLACGTAAATRSGYPKRILYGNTVPLSLQTPDDAQNRWRFEVVFDYGEHSAGGRPDLCRRARLADARRLVLVVPRRIRDPHAQVVPARPDVSSIPGARRRAAPGRRDRTHSRRTAGRSDPRSRHVPRLPHEPRDRRHRRARTARGRVHVQRGPAQTTSRPSSRRT